MPSHVKRTILIAIGVVAAEVVFCWLAMVVAQAIVLYGGK